MGEGRGGSAAGGGIYVASGSLVLNNDVFESNQASGGAEGTGGTGGTGGIGGTGAAPADGGGIANAGTLAVTNSTIAHNGTYGYGGGIDNAGTLTVTNSTVEYNTRGGIYGGGTITVANSTIAYNSTISDGGGVFSYGTLTVTNSTIAYNSATDSGGGIICGGAPMITNSTIAYNDVANGGAGGGLDVAFGVATLDNTIIALNTEGTGIGAAASDISLLGDGSGTVSSSSAYNLIGTGGSGGLTNGADGNQVGVTNPGLGTLTDKGGTTQTIPLLPDSPAIDKGSNALAVDPATEKPLTTDQRGTGFARIVNGTVDIGAYEVQTWQFVVKAPKSIAAGDGFNVTAALESSSGSVDGSFNGSVTVALYSNPTHTSLGGNLTVTAKNGVATFSGLTIDKVGDSYTLLISAMGLTDATTNAISVTPAAATQLVVTTQPPANVFLGIGFGLVVAAEDQFKNVDTNFAGSVAVALLNNPGERHSRWIVECNDPERRGYILWLDAEWSWRRIHAPSLHQPLNQRDHSSVQRLRPEDLHRRSYQRRWFRLRNFRRFGLCDRPGRRITRS